MDESARIGAVLVRYDEIGLKGGNRDAFERRLQENLLRALAGTPDLQVRRLRGRVLLRGAAHPEQLAAAASRVFGVTSVSAAVETARDLEAIAASAEELTARALREDFAGGPRVPFRVAVNRADKTFPLRGMEIERRLGERLLRSFPTLQVNLSAPALRLEVDLRPEGTWVFAGRRPGPGGLPVGSVGRALCLLSGGIDSPAAAWLAMRRGLRLEFAGFYSFPYVGPQWREKLRRIVALLSAWQGRTILHLVPFAAVQEAIRDRGPDRYRTLLYRRSMHRIAHQLARRRRCYALVTGENLGQVASQTLANLGLIEQASELPVLRPVITYDKQEIIRLARQIGSYELSLLPATDACTVFQPEQPILHGKLEEVQAAEAGLDLEALTWDALRRTERLYLTATP